jgi:hypothetical protein
MQVSERRRRTIPEMECEVQVQDIVPATGGLTVSPRFRIKVYPSVDRGVANRVSYFHYACPENQSVTGAPGKEPALFWQDSMGPRRDVQHSIFRRPHR